jgi:hypothetical protein
MLDRAYDLQENSLYKQVIPDVLEAVTQKQAIRRSTLEVTHYNEDLPVVVQ